MLSGVFEVGDRFVIVPGLVLFSGMSIHRPVGTSFMVVALVSASGIALQLWAVRTIAPVLTNLFIAGGIAGSFAGHQIGRQITGPALQKFFVVAILAVAVLSSFAISTSEHPMRCSDLIRHLNPRTPCHR